MPKLKDPSKEFSKEEIRDIKAQLFRVNTSFHCINPAPLSWAKAYQEQQVPS